MRIEKLKIVGYQILREITIEPRQGLPMPNDRRLQSSIDLLVGVNGTGKSTLLKALAIIFQCLEQDNSIPPFGFSLTYKLDKYPDSIFISNLEGETTTILPYFRFRLGENGENAVRKISEEYLPPYIIALTSGSEAGWIYSNDNIDEVDTGLLSRDFQQGANLEDLLKSWDLTEMRGAPLETLLSQMKLNPDSRFQLITAQIMPYIVLSGLLSDMVNGNQYLHNILEAAKIKQLYGFSLQLYLNKEQIHPDRFPFLSRLWDCATYIIQTGQNYLLVFLFDDQKNPLKSSLTAEKSRNPCRPEQLLGEAEGTHGNGLEFFTNMLRLMVTDVPNSQIIQKLNLFLKSARPLPRVLDENESSAAKASLYLFDWLSDGEQSLLGRLCLLPLLSYTEALVLLDEPEVHFNDFWKRQLLQILHQSLQQQHPDQRPTSSHILMTTHSSITLSDVANTNIWILERDDDYQSHATQPHLRTLGTDPSDIIVHIFRADSAVGAFSAAYIREQLVIAEKKPPKERLEMLNELLKRVGPGYWRYLIRREILSLEAPQLWNVLTERG